MIRSNKKAKHYSIKELLPYIAGILLIYGGILHLIDAFYLHYGLVEPSPILKLGTFDPHFFDKTVITTEAVFGIIDIVLGVGIYRKNKRAMVISIFMVFITVAKYVFIRSHPQVTIIEILFLLTIIFTLKYHGKDNSYRMKQLKHYVAWFSVILALCFGIFGSYLFRHHYSNLNSIVDAIYYTISTYSTVGYGDITPITNEAKIFTSVMILIGIGSFMTTLSFVLAPMVNDKLKGIFNIMEKITNITDHVVICGYNKMSMAIITQLDRNNIPYIIIEKSSEKIKELEEINANFIIGNPSKKDTFNKAYV